MFILCLIIIALIYLIIAVRWIHIRQKRRIINNIRERGPKTYIIFPEEEDSDKE